VSKEVINKVFAWLSGFMLGASTVAWIVHEINLIAYKEPFTIAVFIVGWLLLALVFVLSNKGGR
jgi:hypothetical protein